MPQRKLRLGAELLLRRSGRDGRRSSGRVFEDPGTKGSVRRQIDIQDLDLLCNSKNCRGAPPPAPVSIADTGQASAKGGQSSAIPRFRREYLQLAVSSGRSSGTGP